MMLIHVSPIEPSSTQCDDLVYGMDCNSRWLLVYAQPPLDIHDLMLMPLCLCERCGRKERKVFEMYKIEALAARDRKDKVDIENLRNEVKCSSDGRLAQLRDRFIYLFIYLFILLLLFYYFLKIKQQI